MLRSLLTLYTCVLLPVSVQADKPTPDSAAELEVGRNWQVVEYRQTWAAGSDTTVRLDNFYGDVWVRKGEAGHVVIEASVQQHTEDPRQFDFGITENGSGSIELSVGFKTDAGATIADNVSAVDNRRRIDVGILVPETMAIEVKTGSGNINVKEHRGALTASSQSGHIQVISFGTVATDNREGLTEVTFAHLAGESRFASRAGRIAIYLPSRPEFSLQGTTRGLVTSDFSMQLERDVQTGLKHVSMTQGDPAKSLIIESARGDLSVVETGIQAQQSE